MIRTSQHSIKFSNKNKKRELNLFITEYKKVLNLIVDDLWKDINPSNPESRKFLDNDYLKQFETHLTQRHLQCIGKQACAMIGAAIKKRQKQLYMLRKLQREGKPIKYLQRKIDKQPLIKPNPEKANLELDSRFVDFQIGNHFDQFVKIKIGNRKSINVPIKNTKVSNKWLAKGKLKGSIRLNNKSINLFYEINNSKLVGNKAIAIDQGYKTVASLSDGQVTQKDNHGYDLETINRKLSRKKKGSRNFQKVQEHRKNYINWSINQLNFNGVKELRLEKIKNLRRGKKINRLMSHWTYTLIKDKFIRLSEQEGFKFTEVPNEFRSQRCSQCGWVRKANRKNKLFKCDHCGFTHDSDLNASSNLLLDLYKVPYWVRLKKLNREGFYWKSNGLFTSDQECIVSDAQKPTYEYSS